MGCTQTPPNDSADSHSPVASIPLLQLDNLWFQLAGTICNLSCTHCFISCSPNNDSFQFLDRQTVKRFVTEGKRLGVKEFYFTGGESFLNKEIYNILSDTLEVGPASVLTNGTVIRQRVAARLKAISDASIYSLELRVSLDGFDAASNDRLRGAGSFDSAVKGIKALVDAGFLPIITAVQTWTDCEHTQILENFKQTMREIGYTRPRIKIIPALNLGEHKRNRSDRPQEYLVTEEMMAVSDPGRLLCSNSRIVTDKGVFVCPILVDARDANLGETLEAASGTYRLNHKACYTCYMAGAICSNFASSAREAESSPDVNQTVSQE